MNNSKIVWLIPEEKQKKLKELVTAEIDKEVDIPFTPYLKRINSYKGIVTTQCCTGHEGEKQPYLSMRMTKTMLDIFLKHFFADTNINFSTVDLTYEGNYEIKPRLVVTFYRDEVKDGEYIRYWQHGVIQFLKFLEEIYNANWISKEPLGKIGCLKGAIDEK